MEDACQLQEEGEAAASLTELGDLIEVTLVLRSWIFSLLYLHSLLI